MFESGTNGFSFVLSVMPEKIYQKAVDCPLPEYYLQVIRATIDTLSDN